MAAITSSSRKSIVSDPGTFKVLRKPEERKSFNTFNFSVPSWPTMLPAKAKIASRSRPYPLPNSVKITVSSGADETVFYVDKDLLCKESLFFSAAFNGPFLESKTQSMVLEDIKSRDFTIFIDWILHIQNPLKYHFELSGNALALATMLEFQDRFLIERCRFWYEHVLEKYVQSMTPSWENVQTGAELRVR
jgi:BTB/POZ domain